MYVINSSNGSSRVIWEVAGDSCRTGTTVVVTSSMKEAADSCCGTVSWKKTDSFHLYHRGHGVSQDVTHKDEEHQTLGNRVEAGYQTKSYRCDLICTHTICPVRELFGSKSPFSNLHISMSFTYTLVNTKKILSLSNWFSSSFADLSACGSPLCSVRLWRWTWWKLTGALLNICCLLFQLILSKLQNLVPTGVNYVIILSCTVVLTLSGFSRSISSSRVTWEASGNCNGGGTKVMATVLRKLREMRTVLSERIIRFK